MNTKTDSKRGDAFGVAGQQLSAVIFIQDYVQLDFNGPLLTAYNWPIIINKDKLWNMSIPNYRDKLCEQITKVVANFIVNPNEKIILDFTDGSKIEIPLIIGPEGPPEAAMIVDSARYVREVWN